MQKTKLGKFESAYICVIPLNFQFAPLTQKVKSKLQDIRLPV